MPLSKDIKDLFCFEFKGKRYQFDRLPLGWNSSACIFHDVLRRCINDLSGVYSYIDDILIGGETPEQHDSRIHALMKRLTHYGFHVNIEKIQWRRQSVDYLGFDVGYGGFSCDTYIKRQTARLPVNASIRQLQQALGMANVLRHFVPNLAVWCVPFYHLLKCRAVEDWNRVDKQFKALWSKILSNAVMLA